MKCQNCDSKCEGTHKLEAKYFRYSVAGINTGTIEVCSTCNEFYLVRKGKLAAIVNSSSDKRVIVAGPGTGKTFTFKEVIRSFTSPRSVLIFTLINNLADDLRTDFHDEKYEAVEVTTFHGYCKRLLYSKLGVDSIYFPELPQLIAQDAGLLGYKWTIKDFSEAFADIAGDSPALKFFLKRATFYNAAGHGDSVYKVYTHYIKNKETVPAYGLVIADEYQDFNKLEASLVRLLAEKSPILIAGDDDQAVYGFRKASTKYIRDLYSDSSYENFNLPYSSRCPEVLVEATKKIISKATDQGLMGDRIAGKDFLSYWPDKFMYSNKYAKISVAHCSYDKTAQLLVKEHIEKIVADENLTGEEEEIQFLIIGAESQHRLDSLAMYLSSSLDTSKYEIVVKNTNSEKKIHFGYRLLSKDPRSSLGWRIIVDSDPPKDLIKIIRASYEENIALRDLLSEEYVDVHLQRMEELLSSSEDSSIDNMDSPQKVRVRLTNFLGSKGLSALHVLIYEFHDDVLPKNGSQADEGDVCRLVVALTRAKRSCLIVTFKVFSRAYGRSLDKKSSMLKMIPTEMLSIRNYKITKGNLEIIS
jgi:superfamily I DNA/RNA helicase